MLKRKKPLLVILIILILLTLGMGLISKNTRIINLKEITAGSSYYPQTFTGGSLGGANVGKMWLYAPYNANGLDGAYCVGHGLPIALKYNGSKVPDSGGAGSKQETIYEYDHTVEMAQSVAYAYWAGASKEEIQDLLWATNQWSAYTGGESASLGPKYTGPYNITDGGIYGRSTKFANFAYKALDPKTGKLGVESSIKNDNDDALRMMVDQNEDTYTLGPYTLSFPAQDESLDSPSRGTFGELVWDEIVNDFSGKFVKGEIDATITFQDTSVEKNAYVEILDANGEVIKEHFPHFGEEFYIRYKTSKDSPIVDFIKPRIEINYLKKFTDVWTHLYKAKEIEFMIDKDESGVFDAAMQKLGGGGVSTGEVDNDQEAVKMASLEYITSLDLGAVVSNGTRWRSCVFILKSTQV